MSRPQPTPGAPARERWPIFGVAAGLTGFLATLIFDIHAEVDDPSGVDTTMAVIHEVSQRMAYLSAISGYLTVALLLIVAACWRTAVERRLPETIAATLVSLALTASAGALALGYGWKGAMAIYHEDGSEPGTFDETGLYVYYMLNDFGSFIGWLGVTVAAGAVAWLALKDRVLPLWIGIWSCLPVIAVVIVLVATGLPGFPGVVSPIWMVVTFAGLALSRGVIKSEAVLQPPARDLVAGLAD
jgi:hypothetical protein